MAPSRPATPRAVPPALSPARVLAWSEAVVDAAALPRPLLALWRPAGVTVALGLSQKPEVELTAWAASPLAGVELVRRQSGGGAVLLGPGVLCWEALATLAHIDAEYGDGAGIRQAYDFLSRPLLTGLARQGVVAFTAGVSDLSVRDSAGTVRKIAGTAQLRRRQAVLVHGSLLVSADVAEMGRYLATPSDEPDYRNRRCHRDFCLTIAEALGQPPSEGPEDGRLLPRIADALADAAAEAGWDVTVPPAELPQAAETMWREKYQSRGWNWSRKREG